MRKGPWKNEAFDSQDHMRFVAKCSGHGSMFVLFVLKKAVNFMT